MALVSSLERTHKDRQTVHRPTRCLSSVFDADGQRFIQLDTYGSDEREHPDKVSQSVQFDQKAAGQLLKLIRESFPDLG
jgi:hypothetical protein